MNKAEFEIECRLRYPTGTLVKSLDKSGNSWALSQGTIDWTIAYPFDMIIYTEALDEGHLAINNRSNRILVYKKGKWANTLGESEFSKMIEWLKNE